MRKTVLVINTERDGYDVDQVYKTMTVGELKEMLDYYDGETEVYLGFDRHFTFGGIREENFEDYYFSDEDDEDEECEDDED